MTRRLSSRGALALAALVALSGCQQPPTAPGDINIFNQNTNNNGQPGPSVSPSPNPSEAGFDSIRVGIYGHDSRCANPPRNGENEVRLNCTAFVTATPKKGDTEVPSSVHGPNCKWYLNGQAIEGLGGNSVVAVSVQSNPFNVDVRGLATGTFTLEAEVKGVRSGPKGFTVATANSSSEGVTALADGWPFPRPDPTPTPEPR